jgi:hypothetical protein
MEQYQLKETLETLTQLGNLELTLSELYQTYSQLWPEHKEFWMDMEKAEIKHSDNIDRMSEMITERPANFELGRPFSPSSIKSFISGIKSTVQRLKNKDIDKIKALFLARDLEQSYLESKYFEVIKTGDKESMPLMREIYADTVFHREYLNKMISELTSHE